MRTSAIALMLCAMFVGTATARDDGQYANSDLKQWFNTLASGKGLCCSVADGVTIQDVDWDSTCDFQGQDSNPHCFYRVRLKGEWINVPDNAVITEPNKAGVAIVWPMVDESGKTQVRCFIAGSGT
jgi:hypothetical protein